MVIFSNKTTNYFNKTNIVGKQDMDIVSRYSHFYVLHVGIFCQIIYLVFSMLCFNFAIKNQCTVVYRVLPGVLKMAGLSNKTTLYSNKTTVVQ